MISLQWPGVDNGREGLLRSDKWFKTLSVLAQNEGASINDFSGKLYTDLYQALPNESWTGSNGDRSLFRDYQKSWTQPGVLRPTADTGQRIELTKRGRELVQSGDVTGFFRETIDAHFDLWRVDDKDIPVATFRHISHVLFTSVNDQLETDQLQRHAEGFVVQEISHKLGIHTQIDFAESTTNRRRFRSYLVILENAGAIVREGSIQIRDRDYLGELTAGSPVGDYINISILPQSDIEEEFKLPPNLDEDRRRRIIAKVALREGQDRFAHQVRVAYHNTCCVTGTTEPTILEAAHIVPYRGRQTNFVQNGLLLATDIHRLFDAGKLRITPDTLRIEIDETVTDLRYANLDGQKIRVPQRSADRPSSDALRLKYEQRSRP